jgi:hypothetical protein
MRLLCAVKPDERHRVQQPNQGGGTCTVADKGQGFQARPENSNEGAKTRRLLIVLRAPVILSDSEAPSEDELHHQTNSPESFMG